jgi:hypothetical protein
MEKEYIQLYVRVILAGNTLYSAKEPDLKQLLEEFEVRLQDFERGVPEEIRDRYFKRNIDENIQIYREKKCFLGKSNG